MDKGILVFTSGGVDSAVGEYVASHIGTPLTFVRFVELSCLSLSHVCISFIFILGACSAFGCDFDLCFFV
ncbi:hypothetical protein H5410_044018 [Solanum commersonii]|uniref:Uncharacterized protein n=1 Tax=Solanum commersonii TaxID=4109 RepID=A0A9J5Y1U5_SOLCO|nr:hypothetical protein H5410_044018 [Solanum commersonii]